MKISLSAGEWRIMERLWEKHPRTLTELVRELGPDTGWSKSTIVTMVGRLESKGAVSYTEGGRARQYAPAVPREQAALEETESLLRRGCYLGMDRFGTVTKTPGTTLENRCRTIARLFEDGFGDRLLISHDYAPYTGFLPDWKTASREEELEKPVNFTYFERFAVPVLTELGLSAEDLRKLRVDNPRTYFENSFAL